MLRDLLLKDMPRLRDINDQSLGYPISLELTEAQFQRLSQNDQHLFFGFADEETDDLLGYVHAQVYESLYSDTGLNVLALAVHPDNQGQGIGHQLMAALEEKAKEQGYAFIRLNSGSQRLDAHRFYEAIGYDGNKTQKRFIKIF